MADFDGKISIREVERKALDVAADHSHRWVLKMLERCAPEEAVVGMNAASFASKSHISLNARVEKVGQEYLVTGSFDGKVPAGCSRCGEPFMVERKSEFKVFLVPGTHPDEEVSDDPDYVFFYSDHIDLSDVFSEQIIVLEPVAEHPPTKPDGSCLLCHKNPQFAATKGEHAFEVAASPFSKLKDLKLNN